MNSLADQARLAALESRLEKLTARVAVLESHHVASVEGDDVKAMERALRRKMPGCGARD